MAIPLAALLVVAPFSYLSERRSQRSDLLVRHTLQVQSEIKQVLVSLLNAETGVRGYLATGNDEFLKPYRDAQKSLFVSLDRLAALLQDDPVQIARVREADTLALQELDHLEAVRELRSLRAIDPARESALLAAGNTSMDDLRTVLAAMVTQENRLLTERQAAANRADRLAFLTVVGGTIAGLLGGLLAILLFASGVVRRVQRTQENAHRLEEGLPLLDPPPGRDEISQLGKALGHAGALLAERQRALAESEERYRAIARNFPNGAVAMFDHELRFTLMEGGVLEAIGLSRDHFEGKTIWEALEPEVARAVEPTYRAALSGRSSVSEVASRGRIYLVRVVPVEDESGQIVSGMLVALDITDRKKSEDEVRRTEAFLDSLVENIPNMIFVKEAEGLRFVRFNRAGEELLGSPREELIGKNDYDFFPQEQADFFTMKDREVLARGELLDIPEEPVQTRSRGLRILHTKKIPILDEQGAPRYLLGISEDITDRKHAEDLLSQAKEEAERANRAKDEFLSRMSHELRTPLNAILGFGQLLEMDDLTPDHEESVKHILRGGRHLLGLIDEVLDISRIATGKLSLSAEPVSVTEILRETVDLVQPLAAQRGVELRAEDANGLHVLADRQRLKQVLLNLLSNGIKYNREGGEVAVSWEKASEGRLRIKVRDSGPGIAADVLERVFTPFDRLGADQTGVEGTGLGLALSKGLVEAMGGTIAVGSEMGVGSIFTVELPIAESPVQRYRREHEAGADWGRVAKEASTILCVEDNLSNLSLIEHVLANRPEVRLVSAGQGQLGLELAREHHPDLILLDVHLPDISGEETLRRLREDPLTRRIPVVMISADATSNRIKRLFAAGASEYLTKPLDVKRFLEVVDEMLESSSARRPA